MSKRTKLSRRESALVAHAKKNAVRKYETETLVIIRTQQGKTIRAVTIAEHHYIEEVLAGGVKSRNIVITLPWDKIILPWET